MRSQNMPFTIQDILGIPYVLYKLPQRAMHVIMYSEILQYIPEILKNDYHTFSDIHFTQSNNLSETTKHSQVLQRYFRIA